MPLTRREALAILALAPLLGTGAIASAQPHLADPKRKPHVDRVDPQPLVLETVIQSQFAGKQHAVFVLPPDYHTSQKTYPAVLSFAGLGESRRGNRLGAWGWVEKYGVVPAMAALHRGTITRRDFQKLVTPEELQGYQSILQTHPYQGVVLVCPYPPNILRKRSPEMPTFERYLLEELIPYTRKHLRVGQSADLWGVDGISLGGLLSTYIGFKYPQHFRAIGSQQASVGSYPRYLKRLARENAEVLKTRALNIATSDRDPFKKTLRGFDKTLTDMDIPHRFTVLQGNHDKRFVKGPGSMELLLFHDRALWQQGDMPPTRKGR